MLHESVFDSGDLAVGDWFDAWCERMGATHAPMRLASDHAADYRAHQRLISLGAVTIWPATFDQLVFVRTPKLIRQADPEVYHLSLMRAGSAKASWGESQAAYRPGDFHLNDSSRPYEIWTGRTSAVGVEIPKALLRLPARTVRQAVGRRLSAEAGLGALAQAVEAEPNGHALVPRVKDFIRQHLHDPGLTPARIADQHHISRGYLHRLFQAEGETVSAYIRRNRLAGAHRDLADPALAGTPIHVVGARWAIRGRRTSRARSARPTACRPRSGARRCRRPGPPVPTWTTAVPCAPTAPARLPARRPDVVSARCPTALALDPPGSS
ncbi:Helix-turn-helix domain-containing protein [Asanoa hainanensis]|uniref:Helix-turn-helix domain-containing protein n=1 Tax=Asanoa hainanensis TaxID=560556 RepID=A0A239NKG2_9ACTN|nr:AraC family transcriptional regulator [Asanoa hainanensis]SNT54953.1 Helix-turn-helix domain-containing protein [Asanoa hainanensis]